MDKHFVNRVPLRSCLAILALTLSLFTASHAAAIEAPDITAQATFSAPSNQRTLTRLTDGNYTKGWQGTRGNGALTITSPTPMHGLYIRWVQEPRAFSIQVQQDGQWADAARYEAAPCAHQYYPLEGVTGLRLMPDKDDGKTFGIQEITILGAGELPAWVQQWQPTWPDADLMLLFAHPDDEVLFFGGLLPDYAAERGIKVLPVVLTDAGAMRRSELLDSLWHLGVRNYPVFGPFPDLYARDLDHAYQRNGKRKTADYLTELIRRHRPDVIVTHDERGEYGHGVHRLCADLAKKCIAYAADPQRHPDSFDKYGPFEVQKVYLHLYRGKDNTAALEMNWDRPLTAFDGKTGFELAVEAYDRFHKSQHRYEQYHVEPRDSRYSSYKFGLYYSAVGADMRKDDFMENLPGFTQ